MLDAEFEDELRESESSMPPARSRVAIACEPAHGRAVFEASATRSNRDAILGRIRARMRVVQPDVEKLGVATEVPADRPEGVC